MPDRTIEVRLTTNVGGFTREMGQAGAAVTGFASTAERGAGGLTMLRNVGSTLGRDIAAGFSVAATATAGFGAMVLRTGVSYNTLEQTSRAAFKTILGSADAANQMMDQLMAFARQSPFPREAFIEATRQLLGFGFAADKIIPTLGVIQDAVAAMGGGAEDIAQLTDVFAKIQARGKITGEELNRMSDVGINALELLAQKAGVSSDEMRDKITAGSVDAGFAITALTEGMTTKFAGAAANVKNTWSGAIDRVKGAFRDLSGALIAPFIDPKGGGMALIWANSLADTIRNIIANVIPGLTPIITRVGLALSAWVERVTSFADKLRADQVTSVLDSIANVVNGVKDTFTGLGTVVGGLGVSIGSMVARSIPLIGSFVPAISPIGGALAGIILSSEEGRSAFADLGKEFVSIGRELAPVLTDAMREITPAIVEVLRAFGEMIHEVAPALVDAFTLIADSALFMLSAGLGVLAQIFQFIGDNADIAVPAITALAGAFVAMKSAEAAASAVKSLQLALAGLSTGALGPWGLVIAGVGLAIGGLVGWMSTMDSGVAENRRHVEELTTAMEKERDVMLGLTDALKEQDAAQRAIAVERAMPEALKKMGDDGKETQHILGMLGFTFQDLRAHADAGDLYDFSAGILQSARDAGYTEPQVRMLERGLKELGFAYANAGGEAQAAAQTAGQYSGQQDKVNTSLLLGQQLLDANGGSLAGNTVALAQFEGMLRSASEAASLQATEVFHITGSLDQAQQSYRGNIDSMIEFATRALGSKEAAVQYVAELLNIPPEVRTAIHTDTELASVQIALVTAKLLGLPEPTITLNADGTPALATADGVTFQIDGETGTLSIHGNPVPANLTTEQLKVWIAEQRSAVIIDALTDGATQRVKELVEFVLQQKPAITVQIQADIAAGREPLMPSQYLSSGPEAYHRQHGGPVRAGRTYMVGEAGPEMLTMGSSGTVTPNEMLATTSTGPGLGDQWATQLEGAAQELAPEVAKALTGLVEQGVPVVQQFSDETVAATQGATTRMLSLVQGSMGGMLGVTQQVMPQIAGTQAATQLGMVQTTDQTMASMQQANALHQFGMLAETGQVHAIMGLQIAQSMQQVGATMTMGSAAAADSFVAQLNARIPPLMNTLGGYADNVKAYGRNFLESIGAAVPFAEGGFWDPHVMRDGSYEVRVSGERGTGGEAYIPRYGAKDPLGVLQTAAAWHGYGVVPFQEGGLSLEELFFDPAGGPYRIGGHMDHVHAGAVAGQRWEMIQAYLIGHGVPAVPTSTTGGSHVQGSLHYQGRAADYGDSRNNTWLVFNTLVPIAGGAPGGPIIALPMAQVPAPDRTTFGTGIPADQAHAMAQVMQLGAQQRLDQLRQAKIDEMIAAGGMGGPSVGGSEEAKAYARARLAAFGWGPDQWPALDELWNRESGWNPNARNGSSGAAGIPQDITGDMHGGYQGQVDWGMSYIAKRYGSPAAALAFHNRNNWYGEGGIFQHGGVLGQEFAVSRARANEVSDFVRFISAGVDRPTTFNIMRNPEAWQRWVGAPEENRLAMMYGGTPEIWKNIMEHPEDAKKWFAASPEAREAIMLSGNPQDRGPDIAGERWWTTLPWGPGNPGFEANEQQSNAENGRPFDPGVGDVQLEDGSWIDAGRAARFFGGRPMAHGGIAGPFLADSGVLLPVGYSTVLNRTGGPEELVRKEVSASGGVNVTVHVGGISVSGLVDKDSVQFEREVIEIGHTVARKVEQAVKRASAGG